MENSTLEDAIKSEAEEFIRNIRLKESEEIRAMDKACATKIDEFRKMTQAQTDARIRQESAKLGNRSSLDLKKLKLRTLENFINRSVEEAVKDIRDNPGYIRFLLDAVLNALKLIPERVELRVMKEDLVFEKDIREGLILRGLNRDFDLIPEPGIKWGGCIIVDITGGRIFDSTIERIYFRRSPQIRLEVMGLMADHDRKVSGLT